MINSSIFSATYAVCLLFLMLASTAGALDNGVARIPPMRCNSWNVFRKK